MLTRQVRKDISRLSYARCSALLSAARYDVLIQLAVGDIKFMSLLLGSAYL